MRGASAEALAALSEQLNTAIGGTDAAKLGEDLFGVAAVLRAEPGLRRVATDVSTDANAKSGLVRQIFDGKVDAPALDLIGDAVSRRWTTTRDLADAIEHLGVVSVVKSTNEAGRLSDELFNVRQLVATNPELRDALSDPARSIEDKRALLSGLLEGKALPATVRLASQSLSGSHRNVDVAISEYQKTAASVHGEGVAKVRVARDLSDADRQRLQEALTRQYGREIHLNVVVDPDVIGGLSVEIGDDVIDGTVSGRLDDARRALAS